MILYVDAENKVRAVNSTNDSTLKPLYVDESNDMFPFVGWSNAKICCYRVNVANGIVTMMTPYVDSRMLESIDIMGHQIDTVTPFKETKKAYIDDTEIKFFFKNEIKGNISVATSNPSIKFEVSVDYAEVVVTFDAPLEEVIDVTLSIL